MPDSPSITALTLAPHGAIAATTRARRAALEPWLGASPQGGARSVAS